MRVEITENALLLITAESGIESYALQNWWNDFHRPDIENRKATFGIETKLKESD